MANNKDDAGDMNENVERALRAEISPDDLTNDQGDIWFESLTDKLGNFTPEAFAYFEERKKKGLGVGLDKDGNLVHQRDLNALELTETQEGVLLQLSEPRPDFFWDADADEAVEALVARGLARWGHGHGNRPEITDAGREKLKSLVQYSEEDLFERPFLNLPLDDIVAELRARIDAGDLTIDEIVSQLKAGSPEQLDDEP